MTVLLYCPSTRPKTMQIVNLVTLNSDEQILCSLLFPVKMDCEMQWTRARYYKCTTFINDHFLLLVFIFVLLHFLLHHLVPPQGATLDH